MISSPPFLPKAEFRPSPTHDELSFCRRALPRCEDAKSGQKHVIYVPELPIPEAERQDHGFMSAH